MRRRARPAPIPAHMTTGSYFLELVRRHDWPPGFVSRIDTRDQRDRERSELSRAQREENARTGRGWADNNLDMPGTTYRPPPKWIDNNPRAVTVSPRRGG